MNKLYLVKSLVALSLISSFVYAGDIEVNDNNGKDVEIKSSIQMNDKLSEVEKVKAVKVSNNGVQI